MFLKMLEKNTQNDQLWLESQKGLMKNRLHISLIVEGALVTDREPPFAALDLQRTSQVNKICPSSPKLEHFQAKTSPHVTPL